MSLVGDPRLERPLWMRGDFLTWKDVVKQTLMKSHVSNESSTVLEICTTDKHGQRLS